MVEVSWFEAEAYCRWLSEIRNRKVRLPTSEEWLAACATGGEYPWGHTEPTPEHAAYDANVDAPTPVGIYPLGAGRHGHLDLAGNVWEWSADEYGTADNEGRWYAWRGGCWRVGAEPAPSEPSSHRARPSSPCRLIRPTGPW